jgi:hypothetical protein
MAFDGRASPPARSLRYVNTDERRKTTGSDGIPLKYPYTGNNRDNDLHAGDNGIFCVSTDHETHRIPT